MAEKPRTAVLSDELKTVVGGRRLLAAVFVTFRLEPDFFEQYVLPLFFDVTVSHAEAIKRVQMESFLEDVPHGVAVYYDQNGLVADAKPARLDVRRVAVRHSTGIFHPKNVFALVEAIEPDEDGHRALSLVVASMSANLTRAGWWENVEACHIEEIEEGELTRLRGSLLAFLRRLAKSAPDKSSDGHASLRAIESFLADTTARKTRTSDGWLEPHFFDGTSSFIDFLEGAAGSQLRDLNLEVISPYFDASAPGPLHEIKEKLNPREVRLFLPRNDSGEALCSKDIFDWVRSQAGMSWGRLEKELTRGGKSQKAAARTVHAKVYRFFSAQPKREFLFVGSVNLTWAAHGRGGNLETGFLLELDPPRRPEWWLEVDGSKPATYKSRAEDEGAVANSGTRLTLRYSWDSKRAEAYWDDLSQSGVLAVSWTGGALFEVNPLKSRQWTPLDQEAAAALEGVLRSTSILLVAGDRPEPVPVLVQEEGMKGKPSALFDLTPAEILRYWSLLTAEQRAAFLEAHAPEAAIAGDDAAVVSKYARVADHDSFFDRFAGIFISFGNLERHIRDSIAAGNLKAAEYRLFGQKYDSLGRLLQRVREDSDKGKGELVEHYVIALCAQQMVTELRADQPDFFRQRPADTNRLDEQLGLSTVLRKTLSTDSSMTEFLEWFEKWFLLRAEPVRAEVEA